LASPIDSVWVDRALARFGRKEFIIAEVAGPEMKANQKYNKAFTLVEILIVVLILAILAIIVLPRFSTASSTTRANTLADDIRILRSQLQVYKAGHIAAAGYPVGGGTPTQAVLVAQLTKKSNNLGDTALPGTPGYPCGPYITVMPSNPVNGKSAVLVLGDGSTLPAAASDQYGWVYQPSTLTLKADSRGSDETGKAYWDY
jgi:general secretion pathway protein G